MSEDADFLGDIEGDEVLASVKLDRSCERHADSRPPLFKYRRGTVCVSDLSSQLYCEQKLLYDLVGVPGLRELGYDIEETEVKEVTTGSNIHLARELEVHDVVPVDTNTREDRFAVVLLNLLHSVQSLLCGVPVVREVPVFGIPVGSQVFVSGVIDELRCDSETLQIDLVELKTRKTSKEPGTAVRESHYLQVMMYKHLLDTLILGGLSKSDMETHMGLNMHTTISSSVLQFMSHEEKAMNSLDSIVSCVLSTVQALTMPTNLFIEYYSQEKDETISLQAVSYNESWLMQKMEQLMPFWLGQRPAEGVREIEDAWKCRICPYADICDWRSAREHECVRKNLKNFKQ